MSGCFTPDCVIWQGGKGCLVIFYVYVQFIKILKELIIEYKLDQLNAQIHFTIGYLEY